MNPPRPPWAALGPGLALAIASALLGLGGCALNSEQAPPSDVPDAGPAPVPAPPPKSALQRAQEQWDRRSDPAALAAAIDGLARESTPEGLLLRGRARIFRAWAFDLRARPANDQVAGADLEGARQDAIEAWRQIAPGSWTSADGGVTDAARAAPAEAVPAMVLVAWADELLGPERPVVGQLGLLKEQAALAGRAVELDPLSDEAAPLRLHATALTLLPSNAGGDFARARFEFERAITAFPASVQNRVAEASSWAVMAQDLALFRALLGSALHLDIRADPDHRAEQWVARAEALGLLRRQRRLFLRR